MASPPVSESVRPHPDGRAVDEDTEGLLARAHAATGQQRRDLLAEVVERHLGLADALAGRYGRTRPDAEDVRQVARMGLVEAALRYDPGRGSFVGFAVPTVTGEVKRHFRDHSWLIRPPRSTQELSIRVRHSWPAVAQQIGAEPTSADIARELSESTDSVHEARLAGVGFTATTLVPNDPRLHSFDAQLAFDRCDAQMVVASLLSQLTAEERELVTLRFFDELSQEEIAARAGTSQMQVSRRLRRLLVKLRDLVGLLDEADSAPDRSSRVDELAIQKSRRPGTGQEGQRDRSYGARVA